MHFLWSTCAAVLLTMDVVGDPFGSPLPQAHSHNDYEHTRPLLDALEQGFCSVEADVYLVDGALLVAHDRKDVDAGRTLEALYLEPLDELVRKNGGRVYPKGPSVTLLVDIKSEAEPTYAALESIFQKHSWMLTRFRGGKVETNAVTIVLSGNRPRQTLLSQADRWAAYDGRLADLGKELPVAFMPLVSDNFAERFPTINTGQLSEQDRLGLSEVIRRAHQEGRSIRFWATPDNAPTWKLLREAGVDLINTDNLPGLARFLGGK